MNFKNEFVAHCKIDFLDFAAIKSGGSKSDVIDFGFTKNAIIKNAVDKSNGQKSAGRKITIVENTALKILKVKSIPTINYGIVFFIKKIFGLFFQCCFLMII